MKMAYVLGAAIAAAAAFGFADHTRHASPSPSRELLPPAADIADPAAAPENAANPDDGPAISGKVLETIDVEKYTYLRLATTQGEAWAAVSKAALARGAIVTVVHAARMDHFASKTLNRTFDVIYFGELANGAAVGALPPGHPAVGANTELPINGHLELGQDPGIQGNALPQGHPPLGQGTLPGDTEQSLADPRTPVPPQLPIAVPKLDVAKGPTGHTIADIFAKKDRLVGTPVRVRAMVTKVTLDVNGRTFLHVRDGTGDTDSRTNDLAVTTSAVPARGDVVVLDGTLRLDADMGIGYRYPALLENATVVKQ